MEEARRATGVHLEDFNQEGEDWKVFKRRLAKDVRATSLREGNSWSHTHFEFQHLESCLTNEDL